MKKTTKSPRSNLKLSKRKIVPMNELPLDIDTTADAWSDLPQVKSKLRLSNTYKFIILFIFGVNVGLIISAVIKSYYFTNFI